MAQTFELDFLESKTNIILRYIKVSREFI
jgi:hypothetical protein